MCVKFQVNCFKTVGGVDYTNILGATDGRADGHTASHHLTIVTGHKNAYRSVAKPETEND